MFPRPCAKVKVVQGKCNRKAIENWVCVHISISGHDHHAPTARPRQTVTFINVWLDRTKPDRMTVFPETEFTLNFQSRLNVLTRLNMRAGYNVGPLPARGATGLVSRGHGRNRRRFPLHPFHFPTVTSAKVPPIERLNDFRAKIASNSVGESSKVNVYVRCCPGGRLARIRSACVVRSPSRRRQANGQIPAL